MARPRKPITEQHCCGKRVNLTLELAARLERVSAHTGHAEASLIREAVIRHVERIEQQMQQQKNSNNSIAA